MHLPEDIQNEIIKGNEKAYKIIEEDPDLNLSVVT